LSELIPQNDIVKYVDHVEERGKEFFQLVEEQGLEGIVAKEKDSIYVPNTRSKSWLKIPVQLMKEYVIVGYTESEHGRPLSRIMFGEYKNGKLYYVHHSGGGISDKLLYSTFERDDKKSQDVVSNDEMNEQVETASQETHIKKPKKSTTKFDHVEVWKSIHKDEEIVRTDRIKVEGKEITIINPEREYRQGGIKKIHVLLYYQSIADYILPYLKDRAVTLIKSFLFL